MFIRMQDDSDPKPFGAEPIGTQPFQVDNRCVACGRQMPADYNQPICWKCQRQDDDHARMMGEEGY